MGKDSHFKYRYYRLCSFNINKPPMESKTLSTLLNHLPKMSEEEILEIEDKLKYLLQISETVSITDDELKPLLETIPISENELKSFLEVPEDKLKYLLEVPKSIPITEDDLKSFLEVPEDKLSYLLKISETVPKIISKLTDNELILNFVDKVEEISELSPNLSDDEIRHLSECAIQEVLANLNEIPWNNK